MPALLEDIGFGAIWVFGVVTWLYCGYHSLMAMNAYPITGFRNMVWPPVHDIIPVELPAKYILHRNKARRGMTVFFGFGLLASIAILATAFLRAA
jgi:hypothetical protein